MTTNKTAKVETEVKKQNVNIIQKVKRAVMKVYAADCPACGELMDLGTSGDDGNPESASLGVKECPCGASFRVVR